MNSNKTCQNAKEKNFSSKETTEIGVCLKTWRGVKLHSELFQCAKENIKSMYYDSINKFTHDFFKLLYTDF